MGAICHNWVNILILKHLDLIFKFKMYNMHSNPTPNAKSPEEAWTPVSDPHNVMLLEVNTFPKMRKVSADVLRRLKFWQKLKLPEDNDFEDQ